MENSNSYIFLDAKLEIMKRGIKTLLKAQTDMTIKSLLFTPWLILLVALPALSSEQPDNQYNMGIIGFAPYAMTNDDGSYHGYMFEISEEIRKATDLPGVDEVLPLKRLHSYLETGLIDCTILARVPLTENIYDFLAPIGKQIKSVIVSRADTPLSSYEDLKDLIIGVPTGVTLDKKFDDDASLIKFATNGYMQSTKMLQHGRIDAMIGVWDSYLFNMRELKMFRDEIAAPLIFNEAPIWLMCRRGFKNTVAKNRLIKVVNRLRDQGVIQNIIAKYIGEFQ